MTVLLYFWFLQLSLDYTNALLFVPLSRGGWVGDWGDFDIHLTFHQYGYIIIEMFDHSVLFFKKNQELLKDCLKLGNLFIFLLIFLHKLKIYFLLLLFLMLDTLLSVIWSIFSFIVYHESKKPNKIYMFQTKLIVWTRKQEEMIYTRLAYSSV